MLRQVLASSWDTGRVTSGYSSCVLPVVAVVCEFQLEIVAVVGLHALNMSMFHLARGYSQAGMTAYSKLQQEEFASQELGYRAVTHQKFVGTRSEEHTSELQSLTNLVCRLLLEKKKKKIK